MVVRLADNAKTFYILDPRLDWEVGSSEMTLSLEWDVLPSQIGLVPKLYPGRSVAVDLVKPSGPGWEVVPHMVNGRYVVVDIVVVRSMRHLVYRSSLRREL